MGIHDTFIYCHVVSKIDVSGYSHGRRQGGAGGGHGPPLDFHTLSKSSQISKILPFLVVNTGSILIGPPLKIFLPTPLGTAFLVVSKSINFADHVSKWPSKNKGHTCARARSSNDLLITLSLMCTWRIFDASSFLSTFGSTLQPSKLVGYYFINKW